MSEAGSRQHERHRAGGPFVVGVAEQLRHPGTQRRVVVSAPLADLGTSVAAVEAGGDIEVDVFVEAMTDGRVTATGMVRAPYVATCRRCLGSVRGIVDAHVQEVFEARPVEGETYRLDGDRADLEPMVRDAVLLALPLAPLCDAACAGPAPGTVPVAVEGSGPRPDEGGDPRWAALRDLRLGERDTGRS